MRQWLGSVVYTVLMIVTAIIFGTLVGISGALPHRVRFAIARSWCRGVLWLCKVLCRLDYVVEGREHLTEENTVVLWKHASTWETIAQLAIFPPQCWVLKRELIWLPGVGWGLAALKPIAINRKAGHTAVEQVIQLGQKRLQDGLWVMIFPEGTRMPPGKTRRYGISGTLLAQSAGRPIVPVAHNAGDFWPRRGWLKRPGTIRVCIGPPIETDGRNARDVNRQVQGWIETKMHEISDNYPDLDAGAPS